jgi:ACT domain-containing protein
VSEPRDTLHDPGRMIVTVLGEDKPGIIAAVSTVVSNAGANILDIHQGIVQEFFVMTMTVDLANATASFDEIRSTLRDKGAELRLQIDAQHEDVFKFMHRI